MGGDEIMETFEISFQKYVRNRHFSSLDKNFVDQCYQKNIRGQPSENRKSAIKNIYMYIYLRFSSDSPTYIYKFTVQQDLKKVLLDCKIIIYILSVKELL